MGQESNPIRLWLGHMGVVIAGVFLGWIPLLGAVGLLLWNEGRAVRTQRALSEGATNVVSIEVDRLTPANEGRLVHAHGLVTTKEKLTPDLRSVDSSPPSPEGRRDVSMA